MIKCPNKNLSEWKEIERVLPDIKYTVWDLNNGHGIDKAPNGEPSILFQDLLKQYNNDRDAAIKAKAVIYSDSFKKTIQDVSYLDVTVSDLYSKPWRSDPSKVNQAFSISLNEKPEMFFEVVKDIEDNFWSIHFKTGSKENFDKNSALTSDQKKRLFEAAAKVIPFGNYLSTYGELSKGGVSGINRFGKLGFTKIGDRQVKLVTETGIEDTTIPIWQKTKQDNLDINGEPNISDLLSVNRVDYKSEQFTPISEEDMQIVDEVTKLYDKIIKGMKDRLNSVKRYSTKNPRLWNQLQTIISQLTNAETEQGILQFMQHIHDSIQQSVEFLNKPIEQISARQIGQLSTDYIGFYKPLLDNIRYIADTTDIFKDMPDYESIIKRLGELSNLVNKVNNKFINVSKRKAYGELRSYLQQQGMPSNMIQDTINWLDDPKHDSSMFMNWFGMATNSNNAVQQAIAKMLNDVKNATDRETLSVGLELVKLVNAAKEKYGNDVQKLLYERLSDGKFSGYRVKPENWGQMKKDQRQFLDKTAESLGIPKDENDQYVLPADENIQNKWFDAMNKWYSERAERKYTSDYYTLRNKLLSLATRDAQSEIQRAIDSIVSSITQNGVQLDNLLTEAEFRQLEDLRKQKRLLANPFNLDGSEKTGTDAIIAKELTDFNEEVSKHVRYDVDRDRYKADRAIVAEKYGEGSEQLKLWEKRNTVERYTDEFYERIRKLERDDANSDKDGLYQKLVKRRRKLQQLYKDPHTNKINADILSDDERRSLLQLDQDIADAYTWYEREEAEDADKFYDFAEMAYTEQYYIDGQKARDAGPDAYNEWFNLTHYEDGRGHMHPASYYTELRPKEEFKDKYTETVPSGKYTKLDPSSEWYNNKWKEDGPAIQPSLKYYDNGKVYNDMASKPEVKALYDRIEELLNEANSWVSFIQYAGDNRMPQIPARFMQALSRKDGILEKLRYSIEDLATTKADDLDFVEEFSTMPNGDPIKVIPTRFIKMLDDPNTISTDAVAAVVQYYNMAANYRNMSEKQAEVELMLNLLRNTQIRTKKELKGPGASNVYKQAQLLVDRLMYGRNKSPILWNVGGKEVNVGKTLDIVRGFVTKVNLSGNLWSIGTSFFTDATYTTLEAKMGRYFDLEDLNYAKSEFARELPNMMAGIGNPNPKGRLAYLVMLNQVVKDNKELFDRLDQSQVLRAINQNFWFAGYTQADYTVKSHILLSIYHNYRFVENEGFLSKAQYIDKFYPTDRKKGAVAFKQLGTTLYDAYIELPNGDVVVDDKYSKYVTEKLLNDVKNRIDILARRTDGTIREVDKAGIHANSIASYLVLHRNFMVSALHDRFKGKQFNLDLGVIEEGYYRSFGRLLKGLTFSPSAITQLIADYNNMQEYEQYAVRRTLNELCLIAGSTVVAISLASLVDGDDDYNNWFMQATTYLAMRSAFEFRTMYNPFEFLALIKSPTAAFNWFDNLSSFINLVNPVSYIGDRTPFTIIDRGVYKGMPVILKNIIKVTPFKSIIEAKDPKSKRNYLQNQLMNF